MADKDIIGMDVTIEYAGGEFAKGHISPLGVHIDKRRPENERARGPLTEIREAIEPRLKPYKGEH